MRGCLVAEKLEENVPKGTPYLSRLVPETLSRLRIPVADRDGTHRHRSRDRMQRKEQSRRKRILQRRSDEERNREKRQETEETQQRRKSRRTFSGRQGNLPFRGAQRTVPRKGVLRFPCHFPFFDKCESSEPQLVFSGKSFCFRHFFSESTSAKFSAQDVKCCRQL
ncbi:hypothetical protein TGRUB_306370 [Toxoplasma gondii RUB]|uniref:Uncharacterized protein n=1 Tax=Toxoplasma gondii RUB TaxID=935652 RepID=A0A086LRT9_TOXGO|nr:hypothetical protein TGRUB_306370 [Toxoplasma gondii RUB]